MISLVKNLMYFTIYYYNNRRCKFYITFLKAVIASKSLISAGLDIDRILHFVFMIKYSKFPDNIGPGNVTDTFCQNNDKFQKSSRRPCLCDILQKNVELWHYSLVGKHVVDEINAQCLV